VAEPIPISAQHWWALFDTYLYLGLAIGIIVVGFMLYFVFRYRSTEEDGDKKLADLVPNGKTVRVVLVLLLISSGILTVLAVESTRLAIEIEQVPPPSESLVIKVTAFQFNFRFEYPNGLQIVGECRIPAGKTIVFNVTSSDVYHSFGLPEFKLKIDAIPGRHNTLWIVAPPLDGATERRYTIMCYEMCGMGHTEMVATLIVMDPAAFNQWLNQTNGS
jgi:cytochrome c oxidase subunit II